MTFLGTKYQTWVTVYTIIIYTILRCLHSNRINCRIVVLKLIRGFWKIFLICLKFNVKVWYHLLSYIAFVCLVVEVANFRWSKRSFQNAIWVFTGCHIWFNWIFPISFSSVELKSSRNLVHVLYVLTPNATESIDRLSCR